MARLAPGGAFSSEFQEAMGMTGIRVKVVAGKARRQNGRAERHGGWLELAVNRVVEHASIVDRADLAMAAWETCPAKNDARRARGFSPSQRVH